MPAKRTSLRRRDNKWSRKIVPSLPVHQAGLFLASSGGKINRFVIVIWKRRGAEEDKRRLQVRRKARGRDKNFILKKREKKLANRGQRYEEWRIRETVKVCAGSLPLRPNPEEENKGPWQLAGPQGHSSWGFSRLFCNPRQPRLLPGDTSPLLNVSFF
ncbi:hypothetical protein KQX54_020640 [Cotesia glomerata]|uniref:Uncharacterized protein n=1 Tax=Cotesia glomerata TaxID=32391 RepID=A0AAV7HZR7_COTGL|nr:hypothetical protein KQX54_020640 [Cotesia glomerata]